MATSNPTTPAARLRHLLQTTPIVVAPGVYDGISARLAVLAGHQALYQTGAGTSASRLARADLGFLSLPDMISAAGTSIMADPSMMTPVIADADTGFGGAPQVARTVAEYHRSGIAALHIEDQVQSKRCGHLDSKQIVSRADFITRITAAVHARDALPCKTQDRILIIARTDALAVVNLEEAIERLRLAKEAGADMGFLEGMTSNDQVSTTMSALSGFPMLANCVTGGKSPLWTANDAERLGFKIAIFPCAGIFPAAKALLASYSNIRQRGIGIEAEKNQDLSKVDLGGADPKGLRNFFQSMGLEYEVAIDKAAANGSGLGHV
ncbi:related to carboxyphosphonoenolpyruvate phosphonomutase [Melanopsichium pennsylvanicum]|uniref:Related to carboxyphosphonoenolpyruvate phosphonomutase n=2 Tax=Melanopsichium pennsylvanicum TaxID=63383 RepID=A0AAJ4XI75_9BASI|nr:related to carboxyphosphonoenolpyruvate phosphonomutase [Melanopsichium pennsylvanicum 4]SNX82497.1 related to carboxyphosphonoenolpyruvate phosphonomutase [Melanopsichium pennsylvanicum]